MDLTTLPDNISEAEFLEEMRHSGVPKEAAEVLAGKVLSHGLFSSSEHDPETASSLVSTAASLIAELFQRFTNEPEVAWLKTLELLCSGRMQNGWRPRDEAFRRFARNVIESLKVRDFGPALLSLHNTAGYEGCTRDIVHLLRELGCLAPGSVIDLELIRDRASGQINYSTENIHYAFRTPEYWLHNDRERSVACLLHMFREEPDDSLACLAAGLHSSLRVWFHIEEQWDRGVTRDYDQSSARWSFWDGPEWHAFSPLLAPLVEELSERSGRRPDDIQLKRIWLHYTWHVHGHAPDGMTAASRERAVAVSKELLGRIRPVLGEGETESFLAQRDLLGDADVVLMLLSSLWDSLKPLLLALRRIPVPTVGSDLRYWPEGPRDPNPPPEPWRWWPEQVASRLHHGLRIEQERDPELEGIRGQFGGFLLSRLKTKKGAPRPARGRLARVEDMLEPDPIWRLGYVKAVRALMTNPKGKGHCILDWSRRHDPDERVREEAKSAYREMRHGQAVPPRMSRRRPLFAAFLWLRWAHMVSLHQSVSDNGAQRTFRKEVRLAKEKDAERARFNLVH